jgi:hypothetical protein
MSGRVSVKIMNITYIRPADGKCQECEKKAELRPYGRGGKFVCFECMMKDEEEGKRQFGAILNSSDIVVIDARVPLPNNKLNNAGANNSP